MTQPPEVPDVSLHEFQQQIERIYYERDAARGVDRTFVWLTEEIGELARSLLSGEPASPAEQAEFADCLAWLSTLASLRGVNLATAAWEKYGDGCPRCKQTPCDCQHRSGA
ncbi:MAG: nucleotide pyrophosphohydrolase [Planctomycetota bacterium]